MAEQGCAVVITGRKEETLQAAAREIPGEVYPMVWDAAQVDLAEEKIRQAAEWMGGLDIVVNNAGLFAQRREWGKESLLQTTPPTNGKP